MSRILKSICITVIFIFSTSCTTQVKTPTAGWEQLPQILREIRAPEFPNREFDITRFGARSGGKKDCTKAFRAAIEACSKAGGGRVVVPAGKYLTGPIHLKSNVCLEISKEATVHFSDVFEDYLPPVLIRWEGKECYNLSPLIYANGCTNIAVVGEGTLVGHGETWWKWREREDLPYHAAKDINDKWIAQNVPVEDRVQGENGIHWCPTFISPVKCENVLIEGVTLINGPFWNIHPVYCNNVTVRGVTIVNDGPNGDGCNPDSCSNVLIENCLFNTGDDCIAIKSGRNSDGRRVNIACENIVIRNCKMKNGHGGVVIGSEMSGSVRNVFAENCEMDSPNLDRALRIKTNSVRGGTVENIYMRNVTVGEVSDAILKINYYYGEKDTGEFTPTVRNINMENVTSNKSTYAIRIEAYPRSPVTGLHLKNCTFNNVAKGNIWEGVKDAQFINVTINGQLKEAAD